MDRIALSTVVYLPREEVYEFLLDFPRYARYSDYLKAVSREGGGDGEGGPGTRYRLRFGWWKLTYAVVSEVTDVEPPARIEWRIARRFDAEGRWLVEPADLPADAPADAEAATRVRFEARFDPHSADEDALGLPRFVSLDGVVDRARPVALAEIERIVERVVADLEGRRREVDLVRHD